MYEKLYNDSDKMADYGKKDIQISQKGSIKQLRIIIRVKLNG